MLDYLALICLLALCLGHYYLIRGCMAIQTEAGSLHALLEGKMAETNNLLNEMAEILDEGIGTQPTQSPIAQSSNPMMAILTAFLNNKATMPNHGSQEEKRTIHEEYPSQTNTEENEHSGFRPELVDSERTNAGNV